ncbi:hypothetical protein L873DRAFT_835405 [Choiromyces venosus 120613-1]|uniref:Uncharacterized protein n=1 Tax=Choiromyces venosus 120613-1 TaxID=1336337 RepID=A0A3N4JPI4_9PEZI|nr:hypothetical protein L873DRAFT_835405 [Choiromyces venosus 120613-1]
MLLAKLPFPRNTGSPSSPTITTPSFLSSPKSNWRFLVCSPCCMWSVSGEVAAALLCRTSGSRIEACYSKNRPCIPVKITYIRAWFRRLQLFSRLSYRNSRAGLVMSFWWHLGSSTITSRFTFRPATGSWLPDRNSLRTRLLVLHVLWGNGYKMQWMMFLQAAH